MAVSGFADRRHKQVLVVGRGMTEAAQAMGAVGRVSISQAIEQKRVGVVGFETDVALFGSLGGEVP